MNKLFSVYVCFIFTCMSSFVCANILLQAPQSLSQEEIEKIAADWQTCFQWQFGKGCNFRCVYQQGQAGFLTQLLWIPVRSYNFPYSAAIKELISAQHQHVYHFEQPLNFANQTPTKLTLQELCPLMQDKKFIFYTGAGISAAGAVATMRDLEKSLQLHEGVWPFVKKVLCNPRSIMLAFEAFCISAIQAPPTQAHWMLAKIAQDMHIGIVTENVDLLQHRTGICPIFTHSDEAYSITPDDLAQVDMILCIGLSYDDCGFLAYYKKCNPRGILIALNKDRMPSYVSDSDYFVQEDAQVALPYMADYFGITED